MLDRGVQPVVIGPFGRFGGGRLDVGETEPWPAGLDQVGLVQTERGLDRALSRVADSSDRRVDAGGDEVVVDRNDEQ